MSWTDHPDGMRQRNAVREAPVHSYFAALPSAAEIWSMEAAPVASKPVTSKPVPSKPKTAPADSDFEGGLLTEEAAGLRETTLAALVPDPDAEQPAGIPASTVYTPFFNPVPARGEGLVWPPCRLSLALQGGGSFGAFTWGVLDRLLEEPLIEFDAISGTSAGAVNSALLASGFVEGGRSGARAQLRRFWRRITEDASSASLMLIGAYSPIGTSVAFSPTLSPTPLDPFNLDALRRALGSEIDFSCLREPTCPKLLMAATRVRDGQLRIFRNDEITADVVLASTCPPLIHRAVEIDGEAYWDGSYVANPPVLQLVQDSSAVDLLVVQIMPAFDGTVPVTLAAIDRRLDQILSNATLNTETSALDLVRQTAPQLRSLRMTRIVAEDEVDGLAERTATDLGRGFIKMLHLKGRHAADRWLSQDPDQMLPRSLRRPSRGEFDKQLFEMIAPVAETTSASVSPTLM